MSVEDKQNAALLAAVRAMPACPFCGEKPWPNEPPDSWVAVEYTEHGREKWVSAHRRCYMLAVKPPPRPPEGP